MQPQNTQVIQTAPPDTATGGLRVEGVTKRFGGLTAVRSLTLSVAAGEAMAVIGPNGAGKSSLLKLISGVHRPDEGSVRFNGGRIDTLAPHDVARHGIALAHQVPQPFKALTVRENIAIGAMARRKGAQPRSGRLGVEDILQLCGLADKAHLAAKHLRLLDLKRLELARALSTDPALILLDEVAAGLNGRDLEDVIELIRTIHSTGRSMILVEHVEGVVASLVDRVLVIDWGEAIAEGTPAQVAADPKVREVYLGGGTTSDVASSAVARRPDDARVATLLDVRSVTAAYGDIVALRDVTLQAGAGEIVAVLGANGAGKSSLASVISGQLRPTSGTVWFDSADITALPDFRRSHRGVAHCPEGRRVFADLTIRENLCLAAPLRLKNRELVSCASS
ncbi:ATP-binding cassette domain-containing protein [Streptomyces sp. So13.3]|uniref:ATP-binding cassette domain-containing protein n=1 Tax=Streptomyces sp. So13.3 TaxID=2136173 RepID=UPI0011070385|nr:ATP-binding cassette domain-containing protein [Streptomyces sp. So13.3]QNA76300.1 ATP-binding cassette domain-containing protein [Streptomyces sp. So13.3]